VLNKYHPNPIPKALNFVTKAEQSGRAAQHLYFVDSDEKKLKFFSVKMSEALMSEDLVEFFTGLNVINLSHS
jgi:hypothetical protein